MADTPSEYEGCSDGNCLLRIVPLRQHTNGGCRCLRDVPHPLQRCIKRKLWHQRQEINRLQRMASRLTDDRSEVRKLLLAEDWLFPDQL